MEILKSLNDALELIKTNLLQEVVRAIQLNDILTEISLNLSVFQFTRFIYPLRYSFITN